MARKARSDEGMEARRADAPLAVRERPILFSGAMVRAILEGICGCGSGRSDARRTHESTRLTAANRSPNRPA